MTGPRDMLRWPALRRLRREFGDWDIRVDTAHWIAKPVAHHNEHTPTIRVRSPRELRAALDRIRQNLTATPQTEAPQQ